MVSDFTVELILNCALSKVPESADPATQKLAMVPGVKAESCAFVRSVQVELYA